MIYLLRSSDTEFDAVELFRPHVFLRGPGFNLKRLTSITLF